MSDENKSGKSALPDPPDTPVGGLFDRLARRAVREVGNGIRRATDAAAPEMERLARQARVAAKTAKPHVDAVKPRVQKAARDAAERTRTYTRDHNDEIRRAAGSAGRAAVRGVTPSPLRPAVDAFQQEMTKDGAPSEDSGDTSCQEELNVGEDKVINQEDEQIGQS